MDERIKQQIQFLVELDKEKSIVRQTYLANGARKENDAEHAWHAAVMTFLLSEYTNEKIDVMHTVAMLLFHDVVEIDAGDTYAYDADAKKTQRQREEKAADRIYGMLPDDQKQKLRDLWEEFEEGKTPEAKFAHVMDNLQPMMLNVASGGKSWEEHGVHLSQILERNKKTAEGSEALWEYALQEWLKQYTQKGIIVDDLKGWGIDGR